MATIEIHEPELRRLKLADSSGAAVAGRADLVLGKSIASRTLFSDSLLEFGQQRKRRAFATTTSFIFNWRDADYAAAFHRRPAQGTVADVPGCAPATAATSASCRRTSEASRPAGSDE